MHTTGPRRYSKLELCTTLQIERLAEEFCYDTETLKKISEELQSRTSRQAKWVNRKVDRQIAALTALPPKPRRFDLKLRWAALALGSAVVAAVALDQVVQLLAVL